MKLLVAASLLVATLAASPAMSLPPPACIVLDLGEEGGKVGGEVWVTCGPRATVTTCPKDGFCTTVSTEDVLP